MLKGSSRMKDGSMDQNLDGALRTVDPNDPLALESFKTMILKSRNRQSYLRLMPKRKRVRQLMASIECFSPGID